MTSEMKIILGLAGVGLVLGLASRGGSDASAAPLPAGPLPAPPRQPPRAPNPPPQGQPNVQPIPQGPDLPFANLPAGAVVFATIDTPLRTGDFELKIIEVDRAGSEVVYTGVRTACPFPDSLCEQIQFNARDVLERRG